MKFPSEFCLVVLLLFVLLTCGSLFDSNIDTITRSRLDELMGIPEKSDEQYLSDLLHGVNRIEGE